MKKRILASSIVSILICLSLIAGSTFALFTSESKVNIAITSGKVDVVASIDGLELYSMERACANNTFENGGTATIDGNNLALTNVSAGDKAIVTIGFTNNSSIAVKYRLTTEINGELADDLVVSTVDSSNAYTAIFGQTEWEKLEVGETVDSLKVAVELPVDAGEEAEGITTPTNISISIEAVQGNVSFADKWDGSTVGDTSWYNDTDMEFTLNKAAQFVGLSDLVDNGNTFEGKTIKLASNLDLEAYDANGERVSFDPIGYGYNTVFKGTFDGQGHTISNLYQNGWALGLDYSTEGGGLFASVVDATIKNLNIDNSEIVMECIDMGTLVGYSYGNCTYENITVKNSAIANYNRYTGGLIGEVNGTQTFTNIRIEDSVVSALWGTYDASVGGVIGGKWGDADLTFENVYVDVQLDTFNDVCSNYQYYNYRLSGMLIGNSEEVTDGTATASYLKCNNCTVVYRDWVNYTYCEFESAGAPSYREPDEWKFLRVQEGYAYDGVDPNHTHDTDETHEELLVFDQLFGGDKGVKGGKAHTGVTVIYPD